MKRNLKTLLMSALVVPVLMFAVVMMTACGGGGGAYKFKEFKVTTGTGESAVVKTMNSKEMVDHFIGPTNKVAFGVGVIEGMLNDAYTEWRTIDGGKSSKSVDEAIYHEFDYAYGCGRLGEDIIDWLIGLAEFGLNATEITALNVSDYINAIKVITSADIIEMFQSDMSEFTGIDAEDTTKLTEILDTVDLGLVMSWYNIYYESKTSIFGPLYASASFKIDGNKITASASSKEKTVENFSVIETEQKVSRTAEFTKDENGVIKTQINFGGGNSVIIVNGNTLTIKFSNSLGEVIEIIYKK